MKKKILSIILAIAVAAASFSFVNTAYASSVQLVLDTKQSIVINGTDDLEWFYFTPSSSGTYSFRSYNVYASECYLFVKEVDTATKQKKYVQLAYSNKDDKVSEGSRQFKLTYHLVAGTTYYYAVGWYLSESRTNGVFTVMLTNDSYDDSTLQRIEASCPIELEAYTDGDWITDASGNSFFRYNTSKIISNMIVTLYYENGTSTTAVGQEYIDGYAITFIDNQYEKHWHPNDSAEYVRNTFTVKVNNLTASVDIPIVITSRYSVKGKVVDMNGSPVANANIYQGSSKVAVSGSDGSFSFYHTAGQYLFTVFTTHSISRTVKLQISANNANNNFSSTPISICNCDYVQDGIINAKDFSFIHRYVDEAYKQMAKEEFQKCISFTAKDYV